MEGGKKTKTQERKERKKKTASAESTIRQIQNQLLNSGIELEAYLIYKIRIFRCFVITNSHWISILDVNIR